MNDFNKWKENEMLLSKYLFLKKSPNIIGDSTTQPIYYITPLFDIENGEYEVIVQNYKGILL